MIAILCDAGKDVTGKERKVTLLLDPQGQLCDVRTGWLHPDQAEFHWGPILRITPEEYIFHLQIATGVGV